MAKPSTLPVWATDATFTSGPETGSNVVVEPSSGYKTQGFVPDANFVGPRVNWLLNLIYQWVLYLQNLHTETTGFLDQDYTWTGTHTFDTEEATFTQEIQATGGVNAAGAGFDTTTGSYTSTSGGSFITTSGNFTSTSAGDHRTTGAGAFEVSNATGTDSFAFTGTKPTRTISIDLTSGYGSSAWTVASDAVTGDETGTTWRKMISLPHGAVVSGIRFGAIQSTYPAATSEGGLRVVYRARSGGTLGADVSPTGYATLTQAAANEYTHSFSPFTIDNAANNYYVEVRSLTHGSVASTSFTYVEIDIEDPGPRNF